MLPWNRQCSGAPTACRRKITPLDDRCNFCALLGEASETPLFRHKRAWHVRVCGRNGDQGSKKMGRGRRGLHAQLTSTTALILLSTIVTHPTHANDLPSGASVAAGQVSIGSTGSAMTVHQGSENAIVNWNSFSIGRDSSVEFVQPSGSSAILNRVTGTTGSSISGSLKANGQVYLINPNGIAITPSGTVSVGGGFVASTLDMTDEDFLAGKPRFSGNGASKAVTNAGTVRIGRGGYAALIGGTVSNDGLIEVETGKIGLGSGEQATLDLSGDGFLQVAVPTGKSGDEPLIQNRGKISASGGQVVISAATAQNAARHAINLSGSVEANSMSGSRGKIVIGGGGGGAVTISGKVKATTKQGKGGNVTVTGKTISLDKATIDASGSTGGGTILIGGARQGSGTVQTAATTMVDADTTIKADATTDGRGGDIVIWSDLLTGFSGAISAKGAGSGAGGEVEVSGKAKLAYQGSVDLTASSGQFGNLLLDPYNITIANAIAHNSSGLSATGNDSIISTDTLVNALRTANVMITTGSAGSAGSQDGDITVADPLSWTSSTNLMLSAYRNIAINANVTGGNQSSLTLRADNSGQGVGTVSFANGVKVSTPGGMSIFYNPTGKDSSTVNGTSYTNPTDYALFAADRTTINPYMLVNTVFDLQNMQNNLNGTYALGRDIDASSTAQWNGGDGFKPIGANSNGFQGQLNGLGFRIDGLTVDTASYNGIAGGLFNSLGENSIVTDLGITNASIKASSSAGILAAIALGDISRVYTSGSVSGHFSSVGGLIGYYLGDGASSSITQSYSTANVFGFSGAAAGGLVGELEGVVSYSYATGATSGNSAGGLVGSFHFGNISNSFAAGSVNGAVTGGLVSHQGLGFTFNSYWDRQTTGQTTSAGSTSGGVNTDEFRSRFLLNGGAWGLSNSNPYPMLLGVAGVVGVSQHGTYGDTPTTVYQTGGRGDYRISGQGGLTNTTSAGSYNQIGIGGISGTTAHGASLQLVDLGGFIAQRNLRISADNMARVYGDTNPSLTYGVDGLVNGDTISGSLATTANTASGVGTYDITKGTLTLANSSNYWMSFRPGQLTVTPRPISVTVDNITRTYGDANPRLTYSANGLVNGDTITGSLATAATITSGVGTYDIAQGSLSATNSSNYALSFAGGQLTITPRQLIVAANNLSRIYGNANPLLGYTASGLVHGDQLIGGLATAATPASGIGSYAIHQGTLSASQNYRLSFTAGALNITPRQLNVNADAISRYYGDSNPALTYRTEGLVNGDSLTGSLATGATATSNAGAYTIGQGTLAASPNYQLSYRNAQLSVLRRPLTITANNLTRIYGEANPDLTYTIGGMGLANGDRLSGTPSVTANARSSVGNYSIGLSGFSLSPNYAVTLVNGQLRILPRALSLRANDASRTVGSNNPAFSYQILSGDLINGDRLSGSLLSPANANSAAGIYPINQGSLQVSANYSLTVTPGNLAVVGTPPAKPAPQPSTQEPNVSSIVESFIKNQQDTISLQVPGEVDPTQDPFGTGKNQPGNQNSTTSNQGNSSNSQGGRPATPPSNPSQSTLEQELSNAGF
ncbi:beta strand repeat-containing protein [Rhizobium helianthi]|uniref:Beta strand repeat-containing protein n=1 Tax=Rhizobium helianthi TaxID=1132695 RepID=A0ABW4M2H7_9HYPH